MPESRDIHIHTKIQQTPTSIHTAARAALQPLHHHPLPKTPRKRNSYRLFSKHPQSQPSQSRTLQRIRDGMGAVCGTMVPLRRMRVSWCVAPLALQRHVSGNWKKMGAGVVRREGGMRGSWNGGLWGEGLEWEREGNPKQQQQLYAVDRL